MAFMADRTGRIWLYFIAVGLGGWKGSTHTECRSSFFNVENGRSDPFQDCRI